MSDPKPSSGKKEISSLDLKLLLKEWDFLAGAFIRKVYQTGDKDEWRIVFELFVPQKGTAYLSVRPSWISMDKTKSNIPEKPSGFSMSLRKHLTGKKIEKLSQHGFDRILEISAGGLMLILEFVPPGNVILTDPEGVILSALRTKKWRDREIRVRSLYRHPPGRPDPFSMDMAGFSAFFRDDRKVVAVLASDLGMGSEYANKLCSEAGVRPDKAAKGLDERELRSLLAKLPALGRIERQEQFVEVTDKQKERLERIEAQRREALEKWRAAEKRSKERADAIYRKFDTVEAILQRLSTRKDAGFQPIQGKEGLHMTVKLDGTDVPLDMKKSAQENAAFYYEQAKKARRKIAGIEASMHKPVELKEKEEMQAYPDEDRHRDWYEKFKWFVSSDGVLVVAGKNAEQNEILLKTHALPDEWCFHADIRGAAFTVIKSGSQNPPDQTKKEAAEFAAANSKAWTRGLGSVHVFSVQRKNLSKTPPTGMHLDKGSFMVSGQRVWHRNVPLRMAVAADPEGKVVSGPESSLKKGYLVVLVPGRRKASDLSREMKSEILKQSKPKDLDVLQKLPLDELARHVPFGIGDIARK
jgi:predicted ribosome quality control (RQC) complex YloA/Tae2 family protein